jgi:hypothetical protein
MTQADRMLSMPPTNTPADTTRRFETLKDAEDALMEQGFKLVPDTCNWIDDAAKIDAGVYPVEEAYGISKYRIEYRALDATPTRRRFLAVAAFASVAGAGSLAAVAMTPNDVPKAVTVPPAAAIAGHDPVFGLIEAHRKTNAAHLAAIKELSRLEKVHGFGGDWAITQKPCDDENDAFEILVGAAATTVPGLLAKLAYLQDLEEWMLDEREGTAIRLIESFAESIANVWRVQS